MTTLSTHSADHALIPFKHLILSPHNVRDEPSTKESIAELAATLRSQKLLHNLVVHAMKGKKSLYGVADGGRRLEAFGLLIKQKDITADFEIPCRVVSEDAAAELSLIANVQRQQMHPANEFIAFQKLIDQGKTVAEISDTFGVSALIIKRRLKLANIAPALIDAYRNDELSLDCLMAFTITDDHQRQLEVWEGLGQYDRNADTIKGCLTEHELDLSSPVARFVGVKAYEKAGGAVRRDLFAEKTNDGYMMDMELVDKLAHAKLYKLKEALLAEGYAWVETTLGQQHELRREFESIPTTLRQLTVKEQKTLDNLNADIEKAEAELKALDEDDPRWEDLNEACEQLEEKRSTFTESMQIPDPRFNAVRGAIIAVSRNGKAEYVRNLVRPADRKTIDRTTPKVKIADAHASTSAATDETVPASMSLRLTSALTQVIQASLMKNTRVTLALLAEKLASRFLCGEVGACDNPLAIEWRSPQYPHDFMQHESAAGQAISESVTRWSKRIPKEDRFTFLLGLSNEDLIELVTLCSALSFSTVTAFSNVTELTKAAADEANVKIRDWWRPTADNYFQYLNKAAIAATLTEAGDSEGAGRIASLKKAEAVLEAENAITKTTWMPSLMRL